MSRFWTIWLPLAFLAFQMGMEMIFPSGSLAKLMSENGPVEIFQWLAISAALLVACVSLFQIDPRKNPWLFGWCAIAAVSCLYVTGEEVSWGQHFLDWTTPESWMAINDQQETNLHNVSSWLDQKPRLILFIGIIFGGLIIPALNRFRPTLLPQKFAIIYPPAALCLVAGLVLGPYLAQEIAEIFNISLFERVSEVQELYMFYFVLLYLVILKQRVSRSP